MMDSTTGRAIALPAHLRQSIADILTTAIGTRVMRRDYGSLVPALIDQPHNRALVARIATAATAAIRRWEPRVSVSRVQLLPRTAEHHRGVLRLLVTPVALAGQARPITIEVAL